MNNEEITREIFDHLVELAALELSSQEAEYIRAQLNNQLKAIHELEAIPLDPATPIASHGVPYTPATSPTLRADQAYPHVDPSRLLAGAPEVADRYIVVPETQHQDLK
jgi:aspartyl/glutamyl-tRNA(Asn/Gln) amidotransferase C subunit